MSAQTGRPIPTLIYRILHVDNLPTLVRRRGLHAPSCCPDDGLPYRSIHDESIGRQRGGRKIQCGPLGSVDDYVSFYLGPRSPMLYRIWKRTVPYQGGQRPVVYLVSSVERLQDLNLRFVFSDGHGLAEFTAWFDDPAELHRLDWEAIGAKFWFDTEEDPDRCRRKQAEVLVHGFVPWTALLGIGVMDEAGRLQTQSRLSGDLAEVPYLKVRRDWYYWPEPSAIEP